MGGWNLKTSKQNSEGEEIELEDVDRQHIAEQIKEGFTSGELNDENGELE